MAALFPDKRGRFSKLNFFLANQISVGHIRDQCCHLQAAVGAPVHLFDLFGRHGTGEILLVGENEESRTEEPLKIK